MTILYNAAELGMIRTLIQYKGTMLLMVFKSYVFWMLLAVHITLLLIDRRVDSINLPEMNKDGFKLSTPLLAFFLVFYVGEAYSRMNFFWEQCIGLRGTCMNWAACVRNNFPRNPDQQWNSSRLLIASMHIIYYQINDDEGSNQLGDDEWDRMVNRHLLTSTEVEYLKAYEGYKPFLPLVWALAEAETALVGEARITNLTASERYRVHDILKEFRDLTFTFRGHCGQIQQWIAQPTPFPYYHALNFVLIFVLAIFSYGLVTFRFHEALTVWVYVTICLIFLGLKESAVAMNYPFGTDDIDFDVEDMLLGAYKNVVAVLRDGRVPRGRRSGSNISNPLEEKLSFAATKDAGRRRMSRVTTSLPSLPSFPLTRAAKLRT